MKALITGASSGIGYEMAKYLASKGYELILVGRNKEKLEELQKELDVSSQIVLLDLSNSTKVNELYILLKNENIDLLINNAGFGDFGKFEETDINKDMKMINTNITAVHTLTKLFLRDMKKRDSGYILNVASIAAFGPGPLMATYYATKAYVCSITEAIHEELRREKSNVHISCLCPGPTESQFFDRAGVSFSVKPMKCDVVAKYGIDKMFKGKLIIIPGFLNKCSVFFRRFGTRSLARKVTYKIQKAKKK